MFRVSRWRLIVAATLWLPMAGCGALHKVNPFGDDEPVVPSSAEHGERRVQPLEVPPDLVPPATDTSLSVPAAPEPATYSGYESSEGDTGHRRAPADIHALLEFDEGGVPVVRVLDDMEQTWRQVGNSLEQMGISIEERNRIQGFYLVRYQKLEDDSGGLWNDISHAFGKLTDGVVSGGYGTGDVGEQRTRIGMEHLPPSKQAKIEKARIANATFRVALASATTDNGTDVSVLTADGGADDSLGGQQLLNMLYESLK